MKNSTIDIEIKSIDYDLLIYFELLCKKKNTNMRKEFIEFIEEKVNDGLKNKIITVEDKDNYEPYIEEY